MKKILLALLALTCINGVSNGQVINLSPATLIFNTPMGTVSSPQPVTISASGLIPASGYIVITVPIKWNINPGGSYGEVDSIPYSGGTLPPTTVNISRFSPGGLPVHISIPVTGGGVSTSICACDDNPACPCASASVAASPEQPALSVLPNPVVNELIISSGTAITSVAIINLIGKTVYSNKFNSLKVHVDVAALPGGVYLARINNSEVRRFVKQ